VFVRTICLDSNSDPVVVQEDAVLCVMVVRRFEMVGKEWWWWWWWWWLISEFRELLVWVRLSCATALGAGCTGFACARFPVFPRVNFGMTRHRGRNGTRRVSSVVQRGERYCTTSPNYHSEGLNSRRMQGSESIGGYLYCNRSR
jgi:hypothetical protein